MVFSPTGKAYFSKRADGTTDMGNIMDIGIRRLSKHDDANEAKELNYTNVRIYAASGHVELTQ